MLEWLDLHFILLKLEERCKRSWKIQMEYQKSRRKGMMCFIQDGHVKIGLRGVYEEIIGGYQTILVHYDI
jgi:hypothetical protein